MTVEQSPDRAQESVGAYAGRGARRFSPADVIFGALLVIIIACAIYFRFVGQNWDDFTHLHPDERFLTQVAEGIGRPLSITGPDAEGQMARCRERYPTTGGVGPYFDAQCSNWYPRNVGFGLYVYGELPLFTVRVAAELTQQFHLFQVRLEACQALPDAPSFLTCFGAAQSNDLSDPLVRQLYETGDQSATNLALSWTTYNGIHLVGRSVSAVAELLSLVFIFLIGRALYNRWTGLLAVALAAASVFPIQLSHFWTTDAFTNLPVTMAFYFAVRAAKRGTFLDFALFGVGMGAALASRINTLPLFGVVGLAAILYALPALDRRLAAVERNRLFQKAVGGIFLAGLVTFIAFRLLNPHAFIGGPGLLGFLDVRPHRPFLDDLAQAQYLTSGNADFPPNHQWASRTSYLFPARNIILWGMGLPLGLMAWIGFFWAGWQILRNRPGWTRHLLIVVWVLVYFAYMGRQWVMTMRYYMPLYPFLNLLAAWALTEIVRRAWRWMRANPQGARRLVYGLSVALLAFVVGFTYLWATAFTSIYRRQLTRVEASHWVLRNVPSALSATLTTPDGGTRLVNMPFWSAGLNTNVTPYEEGDRQVSAFLAPAPDVDRVIVHQLLDPDRAGEEKTFWAAIAEDAAGSRILAAGRVTGDFGGRETVYGVTQTIMLDSPVALIPGGTYYLVTWSEDRLLVLRQPNQEADLSVRSGESGISAGVRLPDNPRLRPGQASAVLGAVPMQVSFTAPLDGVIEQIDIAHLLNPLQDARETAINLTVSEAGEPLARGSLRANANSTARSTFGDAFAIALDNALTLRAGQELTLTLSTADGAPAVITGSAIATEGPWDDPVPAKVCALPPEMDLSEPVPSGLFSAVECAGVDPWGLYYRGLELYMSAEDDFQKQQTMQSVLDQTDYITISSNRFYDTLSRLPLRFPMSMAFYDALFSGRLGFELVNEVTSSFALGDLRISDQHLPTYTSPAWLNEWESEEAFSVYDHPAVFIFRKDPARYDPAITAQVLQGVPINDNNMISYRAEDATLVNVIRWGALRASEAPTGFMMWPDLRDIQTQGGTWSALFNREWLVNAQPILGVIGWWVVIMCFGWIVWPLLFVLLPGLPDRGYPMAKIAGLLIVSWIAWVGGTLRFLTWSQAGILLIMIGLAALSALLAWRRRAEIAAYVRLNWRHFVIIEAITLTLFVAFVFVRLGNPDLWAQTLGGEKPMNFAYFNAVLRSTVFPPYDPWYAGGYMNYYYYGYVLVGAPVKLLGIMPSVAYNLIVPTLFALTGIGAFSIAFNVVASRWFRKQDEGSPEREAPLAERRKYALRVPAASPYLAGSLALILCVVLGNLGTPAVLLNGIARAGGCSAVTADMYSWQVTRFLEEQGRQPHPMESAALLEAAENPSLGDQLAYGLHTVRQSLECTGRGIGQALSGGWLPIGPERWFWGPRSIITEMPGFSNEINEFPYFTFLFGDLHAHMIALPITLLAVAWLLAEVLGAGIRRRPTWVVAAATAFGGLTVGILRPTNTWDWITYLVLGVVGLMFAFTLRRERPNRLNLTAWAGQTAWFIAAHVLAALPFTYFFATAYSSVRPFEGARTPIWAYLTMHGVFLFIIVSLLIWQTSRLLRHIYIRDLVGRAHVLRAALVVAAIVAAVTLFLGAVSLRLFFTLPIPLAFLLVPLMAWCAVLILIPDQPREWQIVYGLVGLALSISLGVEFVVLDGDIGRQNTFFKFYMQVWMLLSITAGIGLAWLLHNARRWHASVRSPWLVSIATLLAVAALFPITATQGKNQMRMAPGAPNVLDGNAYMADAIYYAGTNAIPLADDLAIIRWLQDNVEGTPVILEGREPGSEYKYNGRISINTGLPTVLGWRFHQIQQRTLDPLPNLVQQREANVNAMYNMTDVPVVWRMLEFYRVEYIVVSDLERLVYTSAGLEKFDIMVNMGLLEVVYDQNGDRIYRVVPGVQLQNVVVGQAPDTPSGRGAF